MFRAIPFALILTVMIPTFTHAQARGPEFPDPKIIDPGFLLEKGAKVDFVFGDDRPFAQCHASTIIDTEDGDLLAAWFAGTEEKDPDVGIFIARYSDGEWGDIEHKVKINETAHWNPVLFRDPRSGIHLFFKVGPEIPYWQTYWITSTDNGQTWSEATVLVPGDKGGRGPVKNKPIILQDGTWLAGASTELDGWKAFGDRSEDLGKTWQRSEDIAMDPEVIKGRGAIQPTLWETKPNHIRALFRTTAGILGRADSTDGGKTWSPMEPSGLPNNNSGVDVLQLDDGRLILVYNPVAKNWGSRSPLNLAVSKDNGETWTDFASLESEPEMEFSYPAIIKTDDGIAISYTWKRDKVRVWQIPLAALEGI